MRLIPALLLPLAFGLAACDSNPIAPRIEDTTFASSLGINLAMMTKTATGLYMQTLTNGAGVEAKAGDRVFVYYTGWLTNGTQFDSRAAPAPPLDFILGTTVIDGFGEGVRGMRVGEKRRLIIPPSLGYGRDGSGPVPGNAIIVFDVELVGLN